MKKSLKQTFLTIPLNYQITLAILIILFFYFFLITGFILCLVIIYKNVYFNRNKNYFFSAYSEIFHSSISFYNLCLLQYEELVYFFGQQTFLYLTSLELLYNTSLSIKYDNLVVNYLSTNITESFINISTPENKVYLYCTSEASYRRISWIIDKNSFSSLQIIYETSNFNIPYYGNIEILKNHLFILPIFQCQFSLNITRIKQYFDTYNNKIYSHFQILSNYHYKKYKNFFKIYNNTSLNIFDLILNSKMDIFTEYMKLLEKKDDEAIENYIKSQSNFFPAINYGKEEIFINDNSNVDLSHIICLGEIINNYLDYLFLYLMTKNDDIINIPLYMENNTIYSQNLCYFFLLKQIRILNNTINIDYFFTRQKLDEIYNNLKKGSSTIEDCILDKYFTHKSLNKIGYIFINKFYQLYQLENNRDVILFQLVKNDEDSYFFFIKHVYPTFNSLKEFSPNFFPLDQLNFYSFKSASPVLRAYNDNKFAINNFEKLILLCIMYTWTILFFIIIFIMNKIKYLVIKPILELKDILNSKEITDESKFEYNYDDDINEFFKICKLLLSTNKERKVNNSIDSGTFLNEIINNSKKSDDNQNSQNTNMILNIKMINGLIDSEKMQEIKGNIIEWNWKKIFYSLNYNKNHLNSEMSLNKRSNKKRKLLSKSTNCIILQKTTSKSNVLDLDEEENEIIELDEKEKENNDLYYYKSLLLITEYLYNNDFYNDKLNKSKNTKNNNILNNKKKYLNITSNKKKDISYIWYSKIKEDNKIDFIKYYFNKGFEEIIINESNNDNSNVNNNNNIIK